MSDGDLYHSLEKVYPRRDGESDIEYKSRMKKLVRQMQPWHRKKFGVGPNLGPSTKPNPPKKKKKRPRIKVKKKGPNDITHADLTEHSGRRRISRWDKSTGVDKKTRHRWRKK